MRNFAIHNWNFPVAPIQIAFIEPQRYGGSGFPETKFGSAFVTESGATWATGPQQAGKRIEEFVIGPNESLISGPTTFAEYNGSGKATAAGLLAGPDGLYFTDLYRDFGQDTPFDAGANLFRIRYVGYADFEARFERSSTIVLTDRSDVPDAETYAWDFGDGTTSDERNPVHQYAHGGMYIIRQTVTGPGGGVTTALRVFAGESSNAVEAEYFDDADPSSPVLVRPERDLSFDWSDVRPASEFLDSKITARFTVNVTPRFSESYRFTVESPDRVRLLVDGKVLVDSWEPSDSSEASASIDLIAGRSYTIALQYAEASDAPALRVLWEGESQGSFIVPRSANSPRRRAVAPR
jgi:hypothetical protein